MVLCLAVAVFQQILVIPLFAGFLRVANGRAEDSDRQLPARLFRVEHVFHHSHHLLLEALSAALHPGLYRRHRDAQEVGDVAVGAPVHIVQCDRRPLLVRQLLYGTQNRLPQIDGIRVVCFAVLPGDVRRGRVEIHRLLSSGFAFPQPLANLVEGDAPQPGRKLPRIAKGREFPVGVQKRVLGDVFCIGEASHRIERQAADHSLVLLYKGGEGGGIAFKRPFNKTASAAGHRFFVHSYMLRSPI